MDPTRPIAALLALAGAALAIGAPWSHILDGGRDVVVRGLEGGGLFAAVLLLFAAVAILLVNEEEKRRVAVAAFGIGAVLASLGAPLLSPVPLVGHSGALAWGAPVTALLAALATILALGSDGRRPFLVRIERVR